MNVPTTHETTVTPSLAASRWKLSDALVIGLLLFSVMMLGLFLEFKAVVVFPLAIYLTRFQWSELAVIGISATQLAVGGFAVTRIFRDLGALSSIGWNFSRKLVPFVLMGAALAGVIALVLGIGSFPDGLAPSSIGLYLVATVAAQPFIEECYFRGILFSALAEKIGGVGSVLSTALLFAAMHPSHRLATLPIALALGLTKLRTRSVAACFVLHATYNMGILLFQLLQLIR